jgi:alpha-N-arabinofuranosidase
VLKQEISSPVYDCARRQSVPVLTSASVLDPATGGVTVFSVNRSLTTGLALTVDLSGLAGKYAAEEWTVMHHADLKTVNTASVQPAQPVRSAGAKMDGPSLSALLPPASWNVIRLKKA